MNALTVWQPWASLIAIGAKGAEFRSWPTPRRLKLGTTIAIHAGTRRPSKGEMEKIARYVRNHTSMQHAIIDTQKALEFLETDPRDMIYGEIVALVVVSGCEQQGSLFRWVLSNVRRTRSYPVRGHQQLWHLDLGLAEIREVD